MGGTLARVKVYLIRHAPAVVPTPGIDEAHRYLTLEGRQVCRQVGRVLREAEVSFDVLVTSPLVRAVHTAEILADAVDYLGVIASLPAFSPGASPRVAAEHILSSGAGAVAVVGHEPSISDLAAFLVGQPGFSPFRKGQVCLFEQRRPVWRLHPDALQLEPLHTT